MKKRLFGAVLSAGLCISMTGCAAESAKIPKETETVDRLEETEMKQETKTLRLTLDDTITYQTIESFGASGAWWSQDVGGWTEETTEGVAIRDKIATLLFDQENGIGLSAYRYNIGAGSANGNSVEGISDVWRRAESFEVSAGEYDWSRDANAVWFLTKAKDMGVSELVFFCNSPLERLTKNGKAYGDKKEETGVTTSNLPAENYKEFATYVLDVVEHFKEEGYPVKYVSPVNEPQWEWTGGQEGCHYEPEELVAFLNVFLDEMEARQIEGIELSAPELGEWGNTSYPYYKAILQNERLFSEWNVWDVHSYWSDTNAKTAFCKWMENQSNKQFVYKMSEWCEMKNGMDIKMDSALNLATEMMTDLTVLDVTSWQYWIAVSCYSYRDGLIYVNPYGTKSMTETKRLWAMGNFSRFIRPGYVRIALDNHNADVMAGAFQGTAKDGTEEIVVVVVNPGTEEYRLSSDCFGKWKVADIYLTDNNHSLEQTEEQNIPAESVVTFRLKNS